MLPPMEDITRQLAGLRLEELSGAYGLASWYAIAIIGALYCFFGYGLFRFILGLTGFCLAGIVAAALAGYLSQGNVIAMSIAGVIGGLCGAMALSFLYKTGVFCLGALGALVVSFALLQGHPAAWAPWAILGATLIGGLLALSLEKPVLTLMTAVIGAWLMTLSGMAVGIEMGWQEKAASMIPVEYSTWLIMGLWVMLTAAGISTQRRLGRKRNNKENP